MRLTCELSPSILVRLRDEDSNQQAVEPTTFRVVSLPVNRSTMQYPVVFFSDSKLPLPSVRGVLIVVAP